MPSAMNPAASRSSASCAIKGLSSFGKTPGKPLPRCVLIRAPASAACATTAAPASEWPMAATLPRAASQRIRAPAPSSSAARVIIKIGRRSPAPHRSTSAGSGGNIAAGGWQPRKPGPGFRNGPSTW